MTPKSEETDTARVEEQQTLQLLYYLRERDDDLCTDAADWIERHRLAQASPADEVDAVAAVLFEADPDVGTTWAEWLAYATKHPHHMQDVEFTRRQARAVLASGHRLAASAGVRDAGREVIERTLTAYRNRTITLPDAIAALTALTARPDGGSGDHLPDVGNMIPAGMAPWSGGDSAPADWDGTGAAIMVDPSDMHVSIGVPPVGMPWKQTVGWKVIVAYTPTTATGGADREAEIARLREQVDVLSTALAEAVVIVAKHSPRGMPKLRAALDTSAATLTKDASHD